MIKWWNEFGSQPLSKCVETLNERFLGKIFLEPIVSTNNKEDWKMVGVKDNAYGDYYVLPRKNSGWWTDFINKLSAYEPWFELEEKSIDATLQIRSLKSPLPKARKTPLGKWELLGTKGKVSIKET